MSAFGPEAVSALAQHLYESRRMHSRTLMSPWTRLAGFQREYELREASRALDAVGPHVAFCPTCTGSTRLTVGLTCRTCGKDYGARGRRE